MKKQAKVKVISTKGVFSIEAENLNELENKINDKIGSGSWSKINVKTRKKLTDEDIKKAKDGEEVKVRVRPDKIRLGAENILPSKFFVSENFLSQVEHLVRNISNREWMGRLLYIVKDDTVIPKLVLLENIGSIGAIDFVSDDNTDVLPIEDYADFTKDDSIYELYEGTIHSHHSIGVFFSGTDWQDLRKNAGSFSPFYLSVVVDNDMRVYPMVGKAKNKEEIAKLEAEQKAKEALEKKKNKKKKWWWNTGKYFQYGRQNTIETIDSKKLITVYDHSKKKKSVIQFNQDMINKLLPKAKSLDKNFKGNVVYYTEETDEETYYGSSWKR